MLEHQRVTSTRRMTGSIYFFGRTYFPSVSTPRRNIIQRSRALKQLSKSSVTCRSSAGSADGVQSGFHVISVAAIHKKLSCRRETARRFVSFNILLSQYLCHKFYHFLLFLLYLCVTQGHFRRSYLKANKVSKAKGTRTVEYESVLMLFTTIIKISWCLSFSICMFFKEFFLQGDQQCWAL